MGQGLGPDSDGSHRVSGQSTGQTWYPGRRGVERCKVHGLGPTGLAGKPPPSCGGGGVSAETEQRLSPAGIFEQMWTPQEKSLK